MALSFPRYGHAAVALAAAVPLLVAVSGWRGRPGRLPGTSWRRGAGLGGVAGTIYFGGTIYWTGAVVSTFGGLPQAVALACAMALAAYMTLYLVAATAVLGRAVAVAGVRGLWLAPWLWVAGEFARGHILGGFPWVPLGSSMAPVLPVVQLASLIGVYGLSWYLVAHSTLIAVVIIGTPAQRVRAGIAAVALLAAVSIWGGLRLADGALTRAGTPLAVALVQANIRQEEKWDERMAPEIERRYDRLTRQAAAAGAEVVLWPESATPYYFNEAPSRAAAVRALVRDTGTPLLFGTDEIERGQPPRYYNSAFMLAPDGAVAAVYRKMQLVPFGEFVPLRSMLFFVSPLVEGVSDFSPGDRVTMLPMAGHMASTAICYEIVYPHLAREAVRQGAELLTTITNDAWYGDSSAPYQHFALASLRAVEQGRYLARAANTGISGVVDPYGRVIGATRVFEEAVVVAEVRALRGRTVYATIGDLVAEIALGVAGLTVVWLGVEQRARRRR
ncbi:MAG: apolipoprotein N-acyltransferase [Vicinamibacterales bacterium]